MRGAEIININTTHTNGLSGHCESTKTCHYKDIASQITSLTIVYSTVYSDADQRKHQGSASLTGEFPAQRASNAENVSIRCNIHMGPRWYMVLHSVAHYFSFFKQDRKLKECVRHWVNKDNRPEVLILVFQRCEHLCLSRCLMMIWKLLSTGRGLSQTSSWPTSDF